MGEALVLLISHSALSDFPSFSASLKTRVTAVPGRGKCGVVGTRFQIPGISLRLEPGSLDLVLGWEMIRGKVVKTPGPPSLCNRAQSVLAEGPSPLRPNSEAERERSHVLPLTSRPSVHKHEKVG